MCPDFENIALDACPFCGVPEWVGKTTCVRTAYGDELTCHLCAAYTWQGVVVSAGTQPDRDEVVRAVRAAFPGVSLNEPAYIAPEHRRIRVSFDPSEPPHAPESDR